MPDHSMFDAFVAERGRLVSIGSDERGLVATDALAALELAPSEGRAILGGDVYVALEREVVSAYANWHVDAQPLESESAFRARSVQESADYIRRYPRPASGTPLFVLVPSRSPS